ncbi:hypothetical protein KR009_009708, partial [Drosophila setifemur]
ETMSGTQDYDRQYLRSMSGLCKVACLVSWTTNIFPPPFFHLFSTAFPQPPKQLCSFIGLLCIACGPVRVSNFRGSFYLAVVSAGFIATLVLLLCRYLRLWQKQYCRCDPTIWSLGVHLALAIAYFTASGLVLSLDIGAYTAAAFFGLTAFSINGLEAYANYRRSRQRDMATQTI